MTIRVSRIRAHPLSPDEFLKISSDIGHRHHGSGRGGCREEWFRTICGYIKKRVSQMSWLWATISQNYFGGSDDLGRFKLAQRLKKLESDVTARPPELALSSPGDSSRGSVLFFLLATLEI